MSDEVVKCQNSPTAVFHAVVWIQSAVAACIHDAFRNANSSV